MSRTIEAPRPSSLDIYFQQASAYRPLSREEEVELGFAIRDHREGAVDRLVQANLRFVVTVAKQYANHGVPIEDLISEGNLGLVEAARRFDPTLGHKFITYAVWWIRHRIRTALAQHSKAVRMPMNRARSLHRLQRETTRLEQRLGRTPRPEELAKGLDTSLAEIHATLPLTQPSVSLDAPLGVSEEATISDFLPDNNATSLDLTLRHEELEKGVDQALACLTSRESEVITHYFGLGGHEPLTLREIGTRLGLTRERVRQIKMAALEKMRSNRRFRFLEEYRHLTT